MPFSFQLSKVEVINTNLAKFQVKIQMGRPLIYNVKIRFANKAFVVAGVKSTFLISACVFVLVLRYMRSNVRVIRLGRPVETFHFIEGCPSPPSQGLTCPVTHLLSPRSLLSERPLGIDYYRPLVCGLACPLTHLLSRRLPGPLLSEHPLGIDYCTYDSCHVLIVTLPLLS